MNEYSGQSQESARSWEEIGPGTFCRLAMTVPDHEVPGWGASPFPGLTSLLCHLPNNPQRDEAMAKNDPRTEPCPTTLQYT